MRLPTHQRDWKAKRVTRGTLRSRALAAAALVAIALGVAYDQFVGQKRLTGGLALTPVIEARLIPGNDTTGVIMFAGVDLTYWTGLPLNQLDLPPGEAWRTRKPGE